MAENVIEGIVRRKRKGVKQIQKKRLTVDGEVERKNRKNNNHSNSRVVAVETVVLLFRIMMKLMLITH